MIQISTMIRRHTNLPNLLILCSHTLSNIACLVESSVCINKLTLFSFLIPRLEQKVRK